VPEFEDGDEPKLPLGGISPPVVSRFGVHLIQVLERREVTLEPSNCASRRATLREQKFDEAYSTGPRSCARRAYVEMREPPQ
jgi:peptidyl-prolyl cis-trans isomerase SurA